MRLSGLSLLALLLISSVAFAQHSGGGGGGGASGGSSSGGGGGFSGGSSSGGGGGGSHSGGSSAGGSSGGGGSISGGGSHGGSSGGSGNHGSSSGSAVHGTALHGPATHESGSPRSTAFSATWNRGPIIRDPRDVAARHSAQPEKRGFFSHLRHPFSKREPRPVAERRPICFKGGCVVCKPGSLGRGCMPTPSAARHRNLCSHQDLWNGGACILQTQIMDNCSGLQVAMQQQWQQFRAAELSRDAACAAAEATAECSQATSNWQSENSLYQSLQARYRQCLQRNGMASSTGRWNGNHSGGIPLRDPM